jgi:hypothetical protein
MLYRRAAVAPPQDAGGVIEMLEKDLVGVWSLVSYDEVKPDGARGEGPLGIAPKGLLIYAADGYVSVNMMRVFGEASGPGTHQHMSYAGTWRLDGEQALHRIEVTPNTPWIGTEQVRDIEVHDGLLTLYGTAIVDGVARKRALTWRRCVARD